MGGGHWPGSAGVVGQPTARGSRGPQSTVRGAGGPTVRGSGGPLSRARAVAARRAERGQRRATKQCRGGSGSPLSCAGVGAAHRAVRRRGAPPSGAGVRAALYAAWRIEAGPLTAMQQAGSPLVGRAGKSGPVERGVNGRSWGQYHLRTEMPPSPVGSMKNSVCGMPTPDKKVCVMHV